MLPLIPWAKSFFNKIGCWIVSKALEKSNVTPIVIFPEFRALFILSTNAMIA